MGATGIGNFVGDRGLGFGCNIVGLRSAQLNFFLVRVRHANEVHCLREIVGNFIKPNATWRTNQI